MAIDNNLGINSKVDLYKRITPALNCKVRELKKLKISAKQQDIWNYLVKTRWENVKGLELSQMVDDILNLDNDSLVEFLKEENESKESDNLVQNEIELL